MPTLTRVLSQFCSFFYNPEATPITTRSTALVVVPSIVFSAGDFSETIVPPVAEVRHTLEILLGIKEAYTFYIGIGAAWTVVNLWYDPGQGACCGHLCFNTDLIRDGQIIATGWSGSEEHSGSALPLQSGDILQHRERYGKVLPARSYPDLKIEIVPSS